ncbi:unnamed protein product [Closterium sp. NIES-65]|nr:unnamed protein product [Closterium sp. NIES-65]
MASASPRSTPPFFHPSSFQPLHPPSPPPHLPLNTPPSLPPPTPLHIPSIPLQPPSSPLSWQEFVGQTLAWEKQVGSWEGWGKESGEGGVGERGERRVGKGGGGGEGGREGMGRGQDTAFVSSVGGGEQWARRGHSATLCPFSPSTHPSPPPPLPPPPPFSSLPTPPRLGTCFSHTDLCSTDSHPYSAPRRTAWGGGGAF